MKKIFRNVVAAFAAVMLVSAFASCSDSDDGDDKKQENPATPAEVPAGTESETVVFEGSTELAWGNRAPEVALAGKEFTGLKISYKATATTGMCFKLLDTSWGAFEIASVTGDGSLRAADSADDPLKAVDLDKTEGVVTVNLSAATVESVKAGLGFQGAPGVTITKIVLVK